jgi:hypothetical protein
MSFTVPQLVACWSIVQATQVKSPFVLILCGTRYDCNENKTVQHYEQLAIIFLMHLHFAIFTSGRECSFINIAENFMALLV